MAAPPRDPKNARVRVSSTLGGTYTNISMARSYTHTADTENATTMRWFGGESERSGDPTDSGTINVWWDPTDPTGQDLLRAARDSGASVFLQIAWEGTGTGAKARQMEARITRVTDNGDVTGEGVEGSFDYRAVQGTITTITYA